MEKKGLKPLGFNLTLNFIKIQIPVLDVCSHHAGRAYVVYATGGPPPFYVISKVASP